MSDQLQQLADTLAVASDIVEACRREALKAGGARYWLGIGAASDELKDTLAELKAAGYVPTGQQEKVTA